MTYLSGWHALWGAALQQHLLLEAHLPPQRLLLEVLPQVWRQEVTRRRLEWLVLSDTSRHAAATVARARKL